MFLCYSLYVYAGINRKRGRPLLSVFLFFRLSKADSNHHKQNQNLLCYHYTIGQSQLLFIQFAAAKVVLFHSTTKYF